jgi:2-iminobutanoate/2-iminopropanoate deaminase
LVVLAACAGGGTQPSASAEVRELLDPGNVGYTTASRHGDLVWSGGHLPFNSAEDAPMAEQVDAILDDLETTLEGAGAGFDTVVKTNVYLVDFNEWDEFNSAYVARMGEHGLPPRTTVQVAMPGYGRIEIEMVAYVRAAP